MRRIAATLGVAAILGTGGSAATPARPASASLCAADERVVYSCPFPRGIGSVCAGAKTLHYRFGRPGHVALDLANAPDWRDVHQGWVVGGGHGYQRHLRFTRGATHYIVFAGEMGNLTDHPGRRMSGIAVVRGAKGDQDLGTLECRTGARIDFKPLEGMASGPDDEEPGGPFDGWY